MKKYAVYMVAVVFAAAFGVAAVRNRALNVELATARAELDAAREALASAKRAKPAPHVRRRDRPEEPRREATQQPASEADIEKAEEERVEERIEAMRREREERREERRRERGNETDEEREARLESRRLEFQARMQEHSAARIKGFLEKAELDEEQSAAFGDELAALDARVREIAGAFAEDIGNGGKFDFEAQALLMYNMSAAVMDAYAGLDEVLPEGWRERDDEFNVLFGIGADAMDPLFDTLRRGGGRGMRGFPFMPRPPRDGGDGRR